MKLGYKPYLLWIILAATEVILSIVNELLFFRMFTFLYPFCFAGLLLFLILRYTTKDHYGHVLLGSLVTHFGYGYLFYRYQKKIFTDYAENNQLSINLNEFLPYTIGVTVNVLLIIVLMAVIGIGLIIYRLIKNTTT